MSSEDPIATKILSDLKGTPYACTSLFRLRGGTSTFIYRGILAGHLADYAPTIIIKHAEAYLALSPNCKLDVIRLHYEAAMLRAFRSLPDYEYGRIQVTTPHLFEYSNTANSAILRDYIGSLELKTYLTYHPVYLPDSIRIGAALGGWLRRFHCWAAAPEQRQLRASIIGNFEIVNLKFLINIGRTLETIELFPDILEDSRIMFREIEQKYRGELERGDGDLIHGDFWTGNILLRDGTIHPPCETLTLLVIDWEFSQIGHRAFDIGQLFAELYLLTHFRSIEAGVDIISSFMARYGKLDDDTAFRVALHFGLHLIVWPCRAPGWGEGDILERCVQLGREFCENAWELNREYFRNGILHSVFYPV